MVSTVTQAGTVWRPASCAGTNFQLRIACAARSSSPSPIPCTIRICAARPSAPTKTRSVTFPCNLASRASSVYCGSGQYAHLGIVTPSRYLPENSPCPPGPSIGPSPIVYPLLPPIVLESPGPGEPVLSFIHGKPILLTEVRTAAAVGSNIVGGTGICTSCLEGKDGRTS